MQIKNTKKKLFLSLAAIFTVCVFVIAISCTRYGLEISVSIKNNKIEFSHELDTTYFNDLEYGDSINIETNNHTKLNNVPYLSTDFVNENDDVCYFSAKENKYFLKSARIVDEDTTSIQIVLNKKQNYRKLEDYAAGNYSTETADIVEETQGVNFRSLPVCETDKQIFRGADPTANNNNGSILNNYLKENNISNIVCLCYSKSETTNYSSSHNTYYSNLSKQNKCYSADIKSFDFADKTIQKKFAQALNYTISSEENVYVHCQEGKDRTGFFCALAEAYYGSPYETIVEDYMQSMKCYHGVDRDMDRDTYNAIKHSRIDKYLANAFELESTKELTKVNLKNAVDEWLYKLTV